METCNIEEAQAILHCCRNTVKKLISEGRLHGTKVGRGWVFFREDVYNVIRNGQNNTACQSRDLERKTTSWHFTNEATPTGFVSQTQVESKLDFLLTPKTGRKRNSSLTN